MKVVDGRPEPVPGLDPGAGHDGVGVIGPPGQNENCWHNSAHRHHHHAPPAHPDRAFAVGAAINAGFVAAEIAFGPQASARARRADAAHNPGVVVNVGSAVLVLFDRAHDLPVRRLGTQDTARCRLRPTDVV